MGDFHAVNPLHCARCGGEVDPERFDLSDEHVRQLAHWTSLYAAIDRLWLDSSAYERWARRELEDVRSRINRLGIDAARSLHRTMACFYLLAFPYPAEAGWTPRTRCPSCRGSMKARRYGTRAYRACDRCRILAWDDNPVSRTLRECSESVKHRRRA